MLKDRYLELFGLELKPKNDSTFDEIARYRNYSDAEIVNSVEAMRNSTLKKELRRHRFAIILITLGFKKDGLTFEDIPWMGYWVCRLKKIIDGSPCNSRNGKRKT